MNLTVVLMTDVVGSTRRWALEPAAMNAAMIMQQSLVHAAVERFGGWRPVDQGEGDSVFAAFASGSQALLAASEIQRGMAATTWPTTMPMRLRVGVHAGEVIQRGGNLFGDTVNRCARIRGAANGGQTLTSSAVFELMRDELPEGLTFRDVGLHRLKDLIRPERLYQLDVAGLATDFGALRTLNRVRHNLPEQSTRLVGRKGDVAAIVDLVNAHRLVTVLGFGGMGKTRAALQVGAELADRPETQDGVWFIDLSTVTDPASVPKEIARVMNVVDVGEGPAAALLTDLAGKHLLLILDNLEQVLGCTPFVAELLAASPGVRLLTTSREPLHLTGENTLRLQPLALPPEEHDLSSIGTHAAVELFVQRAVSVAPGFTVTNATAPAVSAICSRLDGLPLAIELAAAWVRVLEPDELLARLDNALLTRGGPDRPTRHRTLRAAIAWSYDALTHPERALLNRLSYFPASASLEAVEAVGGDDGDDVVGVLTSLVDKSLVTVSSGEPRRYRLLVSIREYARERLDPADPVSAQHAAYFRDLLSRENGASPRRLEPRDLDLAWSWTLQQDPVLALSFPPQYAASLRADAWAAPSQVLMQALDRHPEPHPLRISVLVDLSGQTLPPESVEHARQAVEEARALGSPTLLAWALITLAGPTASESEAALNEAAALLDGPLDDPGIPWMEPLDGLFHTRSVLAFRTTDPSRAEASARALTTLRDPETPEYRDALRWLGTLAMDRGDLTAARDLLAVFRAPPPADDHPGYYLEGQRGLLIAVLTRLGELDDAQALAEDAFAILTAEKSWQASNHARELAEIARRRGDLAGARRWLDKAEALLDGTTTYRAVVSLLKARVLRLEGRADQAAAALDLAAQILEPVLPVGQPYLLAVRVERAALLAEVEPSAARALLQEVAPLRGPLPLPFEGDLLFDELCEALTVSRV